MGGEVYLLTVITPPENEYFLMPIPHCSTVLPSASMVWWLLYCDRQGELTVNLLACPAIPRDGRCIKWELMSIWVGVSLR